MCGNRFCIAIPTGSSDPRRSLHRRWQSFSNNGCHRPKTGAKSWREQSMPPRISISIIGWVASTLSMESLCSGGTQWQASWSPPSKFDEARTCSQSGFSSDTPYSHCCFTQCQGLQLQRAEKRARCDRRQSRCTSSKIEFGGLPSQPHGSNRTTENHLRPFAKRQACVCRLPRGPKSHRQNSNCKNALGKPLKGAPSLASKEIEAAQSCMSALPQKRANWQTSA